MIKGVFSIFILSFISLYSRSIKHSDSNTSRSLKSANNSICSVSFRYISLFFLIFLSGITLAQNSTIELSSNNFSQCIGYKQIGKNHSVIVANKVYDTYSEIIVTKLNDQNKIVWSKAINVSENKLNKAYSFIVDRDSQIVIVGSVETVSSFILKVNGGNGNTIYAKQVLNKTGTKSDRLFKIYQMDTEFADDYIVSGIMGYPDKHVVARFQKNGNQVWCKEYDIDNKQELMYALAESSTGDIILGGHIKNSNYDHAIIKLKPSDGSLIDIKTYDLSYGIYSNGGFDDAVPIKGTDIIALSMIINDPSGKPTYQGILLYNTYTNRIEQSQLYYINGNARGPNITYDPISKKIIIGGVFLDVGNNNLFFQLIEFNDLKKCKTYTLKNIDFTNQSSNAAYVSVDQNQNVLVSAYLSDKANTSISNILLGKYQFGMFNCIKEITTTSLNISEPTAGISKHIIVSNPNFIGQSTKESKSDYNIDTLCKPDCMPTAKLFKLNSTIIEDTICDNQLYNLPISVLNNLRDSLVKVVLHQKTGSIWGKIDSFQHTKQGNFQFTSEDSTTDYMIIGTSRCSIDDTLYFRLFKHKITTSGITGGGFYCQNEQVNLFLNYTSRSNGNSQLNYEWIDSATNTVLSISKDFIFRGKKPLVITLKLFDFCAKSIYLKTHIYVSPTVIDSTIVTKKSGCDPLLTEFIHPKTQSFSNNQVSFSWIWEINNNNSYNTYTASGIVEPNIAHVFQSAGNYYIRCKSVFDGGKVCNHFKDSVRVYKSAIADFNFSPDKVEISNPEVVFFNKSRFASNFHWQLLDTSYSLFSPVHRFNQLGVFEVILIAFGENSCNDTIKKQIEIKDDFRIFIPTAFSPNNDGLNDLWIPTFNSINYMEISILNRWGEELIKNSSSFGWDGKYMGENCPEGVYVFLIKVKSKTDKWYNFRGTLTLLR